MMRAIFKVVSLRVRHIAAGGQTYVGHLVLVGVVEDIVQDVHWRLRLNSNTSTDALAVDVLDELFRVGLLVAGGLGRLGSGGVDGGLVVEAVKVAAGLDEILDPFLRLLEPVSRVLSMLSPAVPCCASVPRRSSCGSRRCPCRMPHRACRREGGSW